jgi:hypothetical protein
MYLYTGFLPLEPSMGGMEECAGCSCHGALMEMTANEYQKLWISEGGAAAMPGYQEIIVTAYPYGSDISVQVLDVRHVLFTIKLLHKCFELFCSLFMLFVWVYVFYVGHMYKIMKPFSML